VSAQPHPRYQVLEKIASGSFATVYRGRDQELGRDVAIKQIHEQYLENPKQLERYWQEAQLLASFQHPNIVTIYDIVKDRGWLIMELMQGNLAKVAGKKQLDLDSLRSTLAHALRALRFLHAHGIVHGDIKPSNMMIDRRKRIKIGDFGLARRVSDDDGSLIKGTTKYMAPEVVSDEFGEVGPSSDLYSLGFVAYELMCGENFDSLFPGLSTYGRDRQVAWMMWHAAPDRKLPEITRVMEGVPEDLARVVQKLISKSQAERYKNAEEALSDLQIDIKLVRGEMSEDGSMSVAAPPSPDRNRRLLLIGAFAASVLMSVLFLFSDSLFGPATPGNSRGFGGVVREVRLQDNLLVVDDEEGVPHDIEVNKATTFWLADEQIFISLRDIKPGDRVQKRVKDNSPNKLEVLRPRLSHGSIAHLDSRHSEFTMLIEEGANRESVIIRVPKNAKILLNGRKFALANLKVDDRIDVTHIRDPKGDAARTVIELNALRTEEVVGFLVSINKSKLTIEQREGRNSTQREIPIADKCVVTINGQTAEDPSKPNYAPTDLKQGDRVRLEVDSRVLRIEAQRRATIKGQIVEIDEPTQVLTVQTPKGERLEFKVDDKCQVTLGPDRATFDDLRKYDSVTVTYDQVEGVSPAATVDAVRPPRGSRLFAIICMQNYDDRNLTRLEYPITDGKLLKQMLVSRYSCAPEQVLLLIDPTKADLEKEIPEWFKRTTNETQLVVYFAGHAYKMDDGDVYLATKDTQFSDVPGTGLKLSWLAGEIDSAIASEFLLLLDASHTGSGADLKRELSAAEMLKTLPPNSLKRTKLIGSCSEGERGHAWKAKEHSVFGWALAEAYSGKADTDKNLVINSTELFEQLKKTMSQASAELRVIQTPVMISPP